MLIQAFDFASRCLNDLRRHSSFFLQRSGTRQGSFPPHLPAGIKPLCQTALSSNCNNNKKNPEMVKGNVSLKVSASVSCGGGLGLRRRGPGAGTETETETSWCRE